MQRRSVLISTGMLISSASGVGWAQIQSNIQSNQVDQANIVTGNATATAACQQACELSFQFDQAGTPSVHTYLLHWDAPDGNLQYIDVKASGTQDVIQRINLPQERIKLIFSDIITNAGQIKDEIISSDDYNFDKFADLRLLQTWPYKAGAKYDLVWLFDDTKNQYILNEAISALQNPRPNLKRQQIDSIELTGWGGGEYIQSSYAVDFMGQLQLMTKVTQTISDPQNLWFRREVRARVNGDLQRICKIAVPSEGSPERTWGDKARCEAYMTKEAPGR